MSITAKKSEFWGEFRLNDGQVVMRDLEKLRLWFRRELNEIWIARQTLATDNKDPREPEIFEWTRYVLPDKNNSIELKPITPDSQR